MAQNGGLRGNSRRSGDGSGHGARAAFLTRHGYAHRGLHGTGGPLENSLPAFAAALEQGYGVECDVHLSADNDAFIVHDDRLDRLTEETGAVAERSSANLASIALRGDNGFIPRLSALLDMAAGRAPVLVELKAGRGKSVTPLCEAVWRDIRACAGQQGGKGVAVMSFHPDVPRWFAAHAPDVVRGLIITEEGRKGRAHDLFRSLMLAWARADFIACDVRDLPSAFVRRQRRNGLPVLSWTVREAAQWQLVGEEADAPIFERGSAGALPDEALAVLARLGEKERSRA